MFPKNLALIAVFAASLTVTSARSENLSYRQADDRITVITHGEEVAMEDWLVKGKLTIFDFYSDGCPPCRFIKGPLVKAVGDDETTALRVIDLNREGQKGIDWDSPVFAQYQDKYKIQGIPFFVIFDAEGKEWKAGEEAQAHIQSWLEKVGAFPEQ